MRSYAWLNTLAAYLQPVLAARARELSRTKAHSDRPRLGLRHSAHISESAAPGVALVSALVQAGEEQANSDSVSFRQLQGVGCVLARSAAQTRTS